MQTLRKKNAIIRRQMFDLKHLGATSLCWLRLASKSLKGHATAWPFLFWRDLTEEFRDKLSKIKKDIKRFLSLGILFIET